MGPCRVDAASQASPRPFLATTVRDGDATGADRPPADTVLGVEMNGAACLLEAVPPTAVAPVGGRRPATVTPASVDDPVEKTGPVRPFSRPRRAFTPLALRGTRPGATAPTSGGRVGVEGVRRQALAVQGYCSVPTFFRGRATKRPVARPRTQNKVKSQDAHLL